MKCDKEGIGMQEIYLDNAATTRVDPVIAARMVEVMTEQYGNPSSLHRKGLEAERLIAVAEKQLLTALGAKKGKILFTSGGTEANNLALRGTALAKQRRGKRIITTALEHSSVLDTARALGKEGFEVIEIPPDASGRVDTAALLAACNAETILVSVMLANNELGTVQPVAALTKEIRRRSPLAVVHSDAVQAFGKVAFSVEKLGVDLLTVSGHKIHAPKGIGALYLADGVRLLPMLHGGEQQGRLRPGTEPVPAIVALGMAGEIAASSLLENIAAVSALRATLCEEISALLGVVQNSPNEEITPFVLNLSLPGYRSEVLLHFLEQRGIFVSSGSACAKGAKSHVLAAMGKSPAEIDGALRVSFSKYSTLEEVHAFSAALADAMAQLQHR